MIIDFSKSDGLVPAIIQDSKTNVVLMLGFMNEEAYTKTKTDKIVTFFSRTKNRLWTKGETTGNFLNVDNILLDCDQDTLLIKATPAGPVCHTGNDTCWNEENKLSNLDFLQILVSIIKDRKLNPTDSSYTTSLFNKGINKVAQKVGEEAVELVIEAKDNNDDLFKNEAADLLYHYLVLLEAKNVGFEEVLEILKLRNKLK